MFHTYSINSSFPNLDDRLHNRSDVSNIPSPFTVNEVNMRFIQITAMIQAGSSSSKVGCVFPMVVVSILFHVVFGPNDRRKDASNFIIDQNKTHAPNYYAFSTHKSQNRLVWCQTLGSKEKSKTQKSITKESDQNQNRFQAVPKWPLIPFYISR